MRTMVVEIDTNNVRNKFNKITAAHCIMYNIVMYNRHNSNI